MAVVEPLMFKSVVFVDLRGLTVKLWKFPLLSMETPTETPWFEMPFWLVPGSGSVARHRSIEIGECEAARGDLSQIR